MKKKPTPLGQPLLVQDTRVRLASDGALYENESLEHYERPYLFATKAELKMIIEHASAEIKLTKQFAALAELEKKMLIRQNIERWRRDRQRRVRVIERRKFDRSFNAVGSALGKVVMP